MSLIPRLSRLAWLSAVIDSGTLLKASARRVAVTTISPGCTALSLASSANAGMASPDMAALVASAMAIRFMASLPAC